MTDMLHVERASRARIAEGRMEIALVLPYPISANRYWRSCVIRNHVQVYPSKEAKAYKAECAAIARSAGVVPIAGPVEYELKLFPNLPQDWAKRAKANPQWWDLTVQCMDLDNARKVLLDALNGICWTDDSRIRRDPGEIMVPDGRGRVELVVRPYRRKHPQASIFEAQPA